jgi:hypothetical protein
MDDENRMKADLSKKMLEDVNRAIALTALICPTADIAVDVMAITYTKLFIDFMAAQFSTMEDMGKTEAIMYQALNNLAPLIMRRAEQMKQIISSNAADMPFEDIIAQARERMKTY